MIFEKPGEVLFNFARLSCGAMDKIKAIGYYVAPASKGHHLAVKGSSMRTNIPDSGGNML